MSYKVDLTNKFKRSLKKCKKRGYDMTLLRELITHLSVHGKAPTKNKPHKLSGKFNQVWECHIEPDWLLLWEQDDDRLILLMVDTGTHSDLF